MAELVRAAEVAEGATSAGGGPTQRLASVRHGTAAEGAGVVGAHVGVALDHRHQADLHAQLLRYEEAEGGPVVLPDVDLSAERADRSRRCHVDPRPALPRPAPWWLGSRPDADEPGTEDGLVITVAWREQVPRPTGPRREVRSVAGRVEQFAGVAVSPFSPSRLSPRRPPANVARTVGGAPDTRVAAAAANTGPESSCDGPVVGLVVVHEGGEAQRHAGGAVPALEGVLLDQRLLRRVEPPAGGQPLDGGDRTPVDLANRRLARQHWVSVDQHGAGAALALPAARLGSSEPESAPQPADQHPGRAIERIGAAVDNHYCHRRHPTPDARGERAESAPKRNAFGRCRGTAGLPCRRRPPPSPSRAGGPLAAQEPGRGAGHGCRSQSGTDVPNPYSSPATLLVAGVGFEPTTFGL